MNDADNFFDKKLYFDVNTRNVSLHYLSYLVQSILFSYYSSTCQFNLSVVNFPDAKNNNTNTCNDHYETNIYYAKCPLWDRQ